MIKKVLAMYSFGRPEIWAIMFNLGYQLDWLWRQLGDTSLDSCVEALPGKINKEKKTHLPWWAGIGTYQLQPWWRRPDKTAGSLDCCLCLWLWLSLLVLPTVPSSLVPSSLVTSDSTFFILGLCGMQRATVKCPSLCNPVPFRACVHSACLTPLENPD